MDGKSKCKILKQIRQQIAAENDIVYVTSECQFKGTCSGTCPKCEAEVRYLEEQLRLRQIAGKAVAVAGIAAALVITASGCDMIDRLYPVQGGKETIPSGYEKTAAPTEEILMGDVAIITEPAGEELAGYAMPPEEETTMGRLPAETEPEPLMGESAATEPELMGDVALVTQPKAEE